MEQPTQKAIAWSLYCALAGCGESVDTRAARGREAMLAAMPKRTVPKGEDDKLHGAV